MKRNFALPWELVIAGLIAVALVAGQMLSPYFLTIDNLLSQTRDLVVIGLLAVALIPVIVAGDIDLSGESILGLSAVCFGLLYESGIDAGTAALIVVALGALIGAFNGALVIGLGLPSLVVTLATLISLRGLAYVLLERRPISAFPDWLVGLGNSTVPGTPLPQSLLVLIAVAAAVAVVLRATVFGRWVYAIGGNALAARYSGVPNQLVRFCSFGFSGAVAALAAIIAAGRFDSVRADTGEGIVLSVLTVVLLGGVSIFGGSGGVVGVMLALVLIGLIQNAMSLANIGVELQALVIGALLIISVILTTTAAAARTGRKTSIVTAGGREGEESAAATTTNRNWSGTGPSLTKGEN